MKYTVGAMVFIVHSCYTFFICYPRPSTGITDTERNSELRLDIEQDCKTVKKTSMNFTDIFKVDVIEHWYEKELTDITNQSIADDVVFFTEYLSEVGK